MENLDADEIYWITIADTVCGKEEKCKKDMPEQLVREKVVAKVDFGIKPLGHTDEGNLRVALVGDPFVSPKIQGIETFNLSTVPLLHAAVEGIKSGVISGLFAEHYGRENSGHGLVVEKLELLPENADRSRRRYFAGEIDLEEIAETNKPINYLIFDKEALDERGKKFTMREMFEIYNSLETASVFPSELELLGTNNRLFSEIAADAYDAGVPHVLALNTNGRYGRQEAIAFSSRELQGTKRRTALKKKLRNNKDLTAMCLVSSTELSEETNHSVMVIPEYRKFTRVVSVVVLAKKLSDDAYGKGNLDLSRQYSRMVEDMRRSLRQAAHIGEVPREVLEERLGAYGMKL